MSNVSNLDLPLPPFVVTSPAYQSSRDGIDKIIARLQQDYSGLISRLSNNGEVEVAPGRIDCNPNDVAEVESILDDVVCSIATPNDEVLLLISIEMLLVKKLGQAALGAESFHDLECATADNQFARSFSRLLIRSVAEATVNVLSESTECRIVYEVDALGSARQSPTKNSRRPRIAVHYAVTIFGSDNYIRIYISAHAMKALQGKERKPPGSDSDFVVRERILNSLSQTYITLSASLRDERINLSQIKNLVVGSILRLESENPGKAILTAEGTTFGTGSVTRSGEQLAVKISTLL